jgi:hypothetical protein
MVASEESSNVLGIKFDFLIEWLSAFSGPSALVRSALPNRWPKIILKFWSVPITISLALEAGLVLKAFDFELENHAPAFLLFILYEVLKWLIAAIAVYWMLRLLRTRPRFDVVVSCYTIAVCYAPIYSIINIGPNYEQLALLANLKAHSNWLLEAIKYAVANARELKAEQSIWSILAFSGNQAIFLFSSVLVSETQASYSIDNFRVVN